MICIEKLAHATCVDVLRGRNSRPPRVVVHVLFGLEGLFVVLLGLGQSSGLYLCGKRRVRYLGQETEHLISTQVSWFHLGRSMTAAGDFQGEIGPVR